MSKSIWIVVHGDCYAPETFATESEAKAFADGNDEVCSGPWELPIEPAEVLIEVSGGVADYTAKGNVKVQLIDHDNESDDDEDADRPCQCNLCDWTGPESAVTQPVRDLHERVEAGDEMPVGECPKCGALALLMDTTADDDERSYGPRRYLG